MKSIKMAAMAAALAFAVPAAAQESSYTPGNYWTMSMIDVAPGQDENYADYLAGQWRKGQDFAKSKGWISGYHLMVNANPREGEPDLYLITEFKEMATSAEEVRREREYDAFMQTDARRMAVGSGARVTMRTQKGPMLLREMVLKGK
jgi:hypothetical protein